MKILMSIVLFLVSTTCIAAPVQVKGARIVELADRTQVLFDLSAPVKYSSFTLDNPPRLVVDLSGARLDASLQDLTLRSSDVRSVRTGIRAGADLRIVVDMAAGALSKTYLVTPDGSNRYRLVVDVYRGDIADPRLLQASIANQPISLMSLGQPTAPRLKVVSVPKEIVIAIDPGHGGKDPGAIGSRGTMEKEVVLSMAKRLQALVNKEPGMRAILTRDDDTYLRLRERIEIARKHQADLFVSLHADAFTDPKAHGSSVFILSTKGASSEAARWLANTENAADLIGGVRLDNEDNFVNTVLFDIYQDATLESSMHLAGKVLDQMRKVGDVHKKQVERAGFAVLKSPDIPSILVETAFITNPAEETKLRNARHQQQLAQAIMDGIRTYFRQRPLPQQQIMVADASAPVQSAPVQSAPVQPTPAISAPVQPKPAQLTPVQLAPLQLTSTPTLRREEQVHVIRRGESLAEIARRYRISLSELRSLNGLSNNQLRMPVGTALTIPF